LLQDERTGLDVKKAAASALAQIASPKSTEILLELLPETASGLTSAIIDALDKIRSEQPEIYIFPVKIQPTLLNLIKQQYKILLQKEELDEADKREREQLKKTASSNLSNIFKLMGLIYPHDDVMKAYQNIQTGTKKTVAYALEMLDNILQKELRDLIIPLVEEYPPGQRRKKYRQVIQALE